LQNKIQVQVKSEEHKNFITRPGSLNKCQDKSIPLQHRHQI